MPINTAKVQDRRKIQYASFAELLAYAANLRAAVARLETDLYRAEHPAFGTISVDEWNQIHLGHAALPMSFLCPE